MKHFCGMVAIVAIWIAFSAGEARAEAYISIGAGQSFSGTVNDYETELCVGFFFCDLVPVQHGSDLDTDTALALGGKIGIFMDHPSFNWLGFEMQYYQRNLDISRQPWSVTGTDTSVMIPALPFNGQVSMELDALKTIAFLVMLRVPPPVVNQHLLGLFEPYLGLGFTINHVEVGPIRIYDAAGNLISGNLQNDSSPGFGYLVSLGLNFRINDRWKLYGEFKHAQANFHYLNDLDRGTFGGDMDSELDITDNTYMFGVTVSFGPVGPRH